MATAVVVTYPEMHAALTLQGFVEISLPGTKERVYSRFVDRDAGICQRVYTSIVGDSSRGVGDDAIRVVLVARVDGQPRIIGADRRVHRVAGWRGNLQDRLDAWRDQIGPKCYACGSPTVLKKTRRPFWGCCRYPVCKTYQDATPKTAPAPRPVRQPGRQDDLDLERNISATMAASEDAWVARMEEKAAYAAVEADAERRAYLAEMEAELAAAGVIDGDDDPPPAEWR